MRPIKTNHTSGIWHVLWKFLRKTFIHDYSWIIISIYNKNSSPMWWTFYSSYLLRTLCETMVVLCLQMVREIHGIWLVISCGSWQFIVENMRGNRMILMDIHCFNVHNVQENTIKHATLVLLLVESLSQVFFFSWSLEGNQECESFLHALKRIGR
jgi:hypothetical protein